MGEICLLSSPSIVVSLEMDIGNETIPVLVMQASLTAQVKDWSSEVSSILLDLEIIFYHCITSETLVMVRDVGKKSEYNISYNCIPKFYNLFIINEIMYV